MRTARPVIKISFVIPAESELAVFLEEISKTSNISQVIRTALEEKMKKDKGEN